MDEAGIRVNNASNATILVSMATSFNGFDKNPASEGADNRQIAKEQLVSATGKSYQQMKKAHKADYRSLFDRVELDLGTAFDHRLPMDERLKRYAEGGEDKNLEILYFQFGRYLLISSSRTPEVPANLQGLWNPYLRPPWSSNYTMNINLQENYWLAEIANLSELHTPLLTFIENLAVTGKVTARTFYGTDGWTACHNSDIWAMSNPVGDFGQGDPVWANWNMAGAWLCTHLWDHFLYTGDTSFLKLNAYPIMKSAAKFCADWLIEDGKGYLITSPSTSPENNYKTPAGYTGATLYGATSDLAMIRELFIQTIEAGKVLGSDPAFGKILDGKLDSLYPYQTGADGHLQEWYHDWEDADPKHRHQSHLYGLYPGSHITPEKTPELAEACRKTLEIKGDQTTGWSMGWRINLWARLYDGNRAYKMYRQLLKYVDPSGLDEIYSGGGGTYPNLLDAHPPFQIDGNFGGSAAVIEMLMHSTEDEIRLLPALPDSWNEGTIHGIVARGGYEISMEWEESELIYATIISKAGGTTNLIYKDHKTEIKLERGEKYIFRP